MLLSAKPPKNDHSECQKINKDDEIWQWTKCALPQNQEIITLKI